MSSEASADYARRAARGAVVTVVGQALRFLVQIASLTVLSRLLAPADYGLLSMVLAMVGIASVIGDFGLSLASIQDQRITEDQRSNLFWTNLLLGSGVGGIVLLFAKPIAAFYGHPELIGITCALASVFFINALGAQFRAQLTSDLRFRRLALIDVSAQAGAFILAAALAVLGAGYWALVAQQVALALVTTASAVFSAHWVPHWPKRGRQMGRLYSFGANNLGVQVFNYLTSNFDNILVGRFFGSAALGVYSRAFQIFRLPLQQVASPLTRVALPILARVYGTPRFERYVERGQLVLSYTFGGLFFVLFAVADPLITVLLGRGWHDAVSIFSVLAIGGVFQAIAYVYYWVFLATANTRLQLRFTILGRLVTLAMMGFGVAWGPEGVATAAAAGQLLMWALYTLFAMPRLGLRHWSLVRITVRPLILFSICAGVTRGAELLVVNKLPSLVQLAALIAVFVLTFLSAAALPKVRADIRILRDSVGLIRS